MKFSTAIIKLLKSHARILGLGLVIFTVSHQSTAAPLEIANTSQVFAATQSISLPDITGDDVAEIGLFYIDSADNNLRLQILDGVSLEQRNVISWNNIYDDPSVHLLPDLNDNSVPEIAVFGIRNKAPNIGKPQLFTRDLSSGANVRVFNWPANWTVIKPIVLDDITGDGIAEVAIQGRFKEKNRPQLVVRNGATATSAGTFSYPDLFNAPEFFQHSDVNGDGIGEISTFGRIKRNNKIQIKIANGTNPANRLKAYNFPDKWSDIQWIKLDDKNNDGINDWGLFGVNKDDNRPQLIVKDGQDPKGAIGIFGWSDDLSSPQFFAIPDMNGDGVSEVAVGGRRSNGRYQFQVKDGVKTTISRANHNLKLNLSNVSFHVIDDLTLDGISEIGFLGTDAQNNYMLQVQNGNGSAGTVINYDLGSQWSSKPSLKNIADINADGLSEILVEGIYDGQTKMGIWTIPDTDSDSYPDTADAFPEDENEWLDTDKDTIGDNADNDDDGDGIIDESDAYPLISIIGYEDTDGDGIPNDCDDKCLLLGMMADDDDNGNGIPDDQEACPLDPDNDIDGDGICGNLDTCPLDFDNDIDSDGICGNVDVCPNDPGNDSDNDGICALDDLCPDDDTNSCVTITGYVLGNGASLNNASVTIGSTIETISDVTGAFSVQVGSDELSNDGIDDFFPVKVNAEGFGSANAKIVYTQEATDYALTINMQQISSRVTENDDITEGVLIVNGGLPVGQITIPASAFPTDVTEITGNITYLDPETDDMLSAPGGDLLAMPESANNNADEIVTLETFGMMEFDLVDQDGNPISELADMAEVCMKATSGLSEGDIVPLWFYDELKGLWIEEGEGTVVNRNDELLLCGEVSHFTWWNFDKPISTHSCFKFDIVTEEGSADVTDLEWYAEGSTYNGTSPQRNCRSEVDKGYFDSFTVKITVDEDNPEQIRVYTLVGGVEFYLLSDGDGTYSLTQSRSEATVFDTPKDVSSCINNTELGSCSPLDYMDSEPDGILPLSTSVNLPPVFTEFTLDKSALRTGESSTAAVIVTDPEGTDVELTWSISCGLDGNLIGGSITPTSDSGNSGEIFEASLTAPESISNDIEYCKVILDASDANGITSRTERFITVGDTLVYQFKGIVYGVDGQPLANAEVSYTKFGLNINNQCAQNQQTTNELGEFSITVDLARCDDLSSLFGIRDYGSLEVLFDYDGQTWRNIRSLDDFGEFDVANCAIDNNGTIVCPTDFYLPTLWGPISGTVYPDQEMVDKFVYVDSLNIYVNYTGFTRLASPIFVDHDISSDYGPILVPLGTGGLITVDELIVDENNAIGEIVTFDKNNTDELFVDIGTATAPITVKLLDSFKVPIPNISVLITNLNSDEETIEGATDLNGEITVSMALGVISLDIDELDISTNIFSVEKDKEVFWDVNSDNECKITGSVYDRFAEPISELNMAFTTYDTQFNELESNSLTTGEDGSYEFTTTSGIIIYGTFPFSLVGANLTSCRPEIGALKEVRWDIQLNDIPGETEGN